MKDDHVAVLLEDLEGKIAGLAEAMADVPTQVRDTQERVMRMEDDVQAIKAAITDQSRQLGEHESRLAALDEATS